MEPWGIVAIYGAAVATITAVIQGIRIFRDRARVKVKVGLCQLCGGAEDIYGYKAAIGITAINKGRRPITLSSGGLRLSNNADLVTLQPARMLPRDLSENKSFDIFMSVDNLKAEFKKLDPSIVINFAWVKDQTERIYKAKVPENIKRTLRG